MSQQRLLSFFTKVSGNKRKLDGLSNNSGATNDLKSPEKKLKTNLDLPRTITLSDKLVIDFGRSWYRRLADEFSKPYFKKLAAFVSAERKQHVVFPKPEEVFSWSRLCDFEEVKVVILGQDPYHGEGQAHGLCFSVKIGIHPPPSLLNIYKELESDVPDFKTPSHGHLVGWAKQGVLLLNACLTVRKGQPNSHINQGWENFTDAVIKCINSNLNDVVFLLWGSYAQKKKVLITKGKHHIICAPHPSPLSAARGWFGSGHFSKANDLLVKAKKKPIDWSYLPEKETDQSWNDLSPCEIKNPVSVVPDDINAELLHSIIEDEPLDYFQDPNFIPSKVKTASSDMNNNEEHDCNGNPYPAHSGNGTGNGGT